LAKKIIDAKYERLEMLDKIQERTSVAEKFCESAIVQDPCELGRHRRLTCALYGSDGPGSRFASIRVFGI
jgi:hypothetical protein